MDFIKKMIFASVVSSIATKSIRVMVESYVKCREAADVIEMKEKGGIFSA